ncbi:Fur family transcriptional regulator [Butyrivibrio sp. MC2013]|uniref:Fur family transcriptional regulator n=1 Tax=Butyrivibrio sp. MC2013 TaxID=1280686 RepID=UPI0006844840|nr:transcriptional repressor [Butyrivibrio sp. MC2013]
MKCKIHAETIERQMERNWPSGVKKTRQRTEIFQILAAAGKPLTATEIYRLINESREGKPYAFSTIYRCLQTFEAAGMLIRSIAVTDENAMYELRMEQHRHYAICLSCHERFPLRTCFLGDLRQMLPADMDGFEITGHQIEIYGYCPACAQ